MLHSLKQLKKTLIIKIGTLFPKWMANRVYKRNFGRGINWENPTEMNEKIRWIQFNTDISKWTLLADKYLVREYLSNIGYSNLLVKTYGKWEKAEEIDFNSLPDKFVIKTNHGCGSVYVVNNKSNIDLEVLRENLKKDLSKKFGDGNVEFHYKGIKPIIFAEELLEQDGDFSSSLVDYKFYTCSGNPIACGVMFNRSIKDHRYNVRMYDMLWKEHKEWLNEKADTGDGNIPIPVCFDQMKKMCKELCKEFPFVRLDFYEVKGKLYFGEFTFTPAALTGGSLSAKLCNLIGERIQLPENK